jgi:hypothetical protein
MCVYALEMCARALHEKFSDYFHSCPANSLTKIHNCCRFNYYEVKNLHVDLHFVCLFALKMFLADQRIREIPRRENMIVRSKLGCLVIGVAAAAALASTSARAGTIVDVDAPPVVTGTWAIGQDTEVTPDTVTPGAVYSDQTNFTGYAVYAGANGTTKVTAMLADDINTIAASSFTLGQFSWSIANGATVAQTISPYIRFFDTTGPNGGPGNLLGGLNFNGISVPKGSVDGFFYDATASDITLPPSFWACEFFQTTGSAANAKLIGEGTFNPVDVGSSADEDFTSTSVGTSSSSFVSASPAGTVNVSPFGGTPVANFEWEFNPVPVPEPGSLGLLLALSVAMLGLRRRRRAN